MNTRLLLHKPRCLGALALLVVAFGPRIQPVHAGDAPAALATIQAPAGAVTGPAGGATPEPVEVDKVLRAVEGLVPFEPDKALALLVGAARKFSADPAIAKALFRAFGPRPQIVSAEFDPVDGHTVRLVTMETVVRTDVPLTPIPERILEFADALAGGFKHAESLAIQNRMLTNTASDAWTRQAKSALAERVAEGRALGGDEHGPQALGRETYNRTCALCHRPEGHGGLGPALAGSDWVLAADPTPIIRIALHGLHGPIKIKGRVFNDPSLACPPLGGSMSDAELAAVLTHIRSNRFWGHALPGVAAAEIQSIRQAVLPRVGPTTEDELRGPVPARTEGPTGSSGNASPGLTRPPTSDYE